MPRGRSAPLSTREEVTLRRVALRYTAAADLPRRELVRIEALGLITRSDDEVALTPLGKERYESLPRASRIDSPKDSQFIALLKDCVAKDRK